MAVVGVVMESSAKESQLGTTCAPLPVEGGTGSPVNPLAIF